jgi:PAS domain S-box-containing protein
LTNITLRSIEKNLPITLLAELEALDLLLDDLAEVVSAAEATRRMPNPENYIQIRHKVKIVFDGVVKLRETYVFDNLIQASAFHAVVAPAISDIQLWLMEGVSGYGPETATTLDIALSRITKAFSKARALKHDSHRIALKIMSEQRIRLEHFLLSVNLLFLLTLTITVIMIFLIARRQVFLRREIEAQTALQRAEKTLQETEELYSKVIAAIPDIVVQTDVNGQILFLNDVALQISGYQRAEVQGKYLLEFIAPEDQESAIENMSLMFDRSLGPKEYTIVMKDGEKIPFEINSDVLRRNDGSPYGIVNICRDITDRKQAEADKVKLEEQYHQAQKMEAIGQLAGGVAHDFNNMLNIILGYSQLALLKIEPSSPLKADLQEIMNATKRSTDLVRQLLAFARKQTIAPKVLDLNHAVADTLNMLRKLIGEDIDLLWMPAANLRPVKMDPTQVDQILANLAVNARDSISGVGKITIETGKAEFDETYCSQHSGFVQGHYVMLAVSDNGCGMDKETCEKIFEPFFTTKEIGKGTGMGLATAYGIVKQNNGFVNVYSEPGKGTTFKIYLPRHGEDEAVIDEPTAQAKPLTGTEVVLLVEDEETLLKMGKMMLEELGYTVLEAGNPNEAIKLAGQYAGDIHLLVTDVVMPEMSGRDLQKRLSALRPDMKYLFMSGYTANVIAHRGILDEGVNFLQKPFLMDVLATKVREALE